MGEAYFLGTAAQRVQALLSDPRAQVCGEMPPVPAWLGEGQLRKLGDLGLSVWACSALRQWHARTRQAQCGVCRTRPLAPSHPGRGLLPPRVMDVKHRG